MGDQNNQLLRENNSPLDPQMTVPFPKGVFRVLTIVSVIATIVGFFIIVGIIVAFRTYSTIHTHGLIVGLLLLGGGLILLSCIIFVNQATGTTISTDSSHSNQNEHNS